MKMTGVDCIRLEEQAEKFVEHFVQPGKTMVHVSSMEMRRLLQVVQALREVSKKLHALATTDERVEAFPGRWKPFLSISHPLCKTVWCRECHRGAVPSCLARPCAPPDGFLV